MRFSGTEVHCSRFSRRNFKNFENCQWVEHAPLNLGDEFDSQPCYADDLKNGIYCL